MSETTTNEPMTISTVIADILPIKEGAAALLLLADGNVRWASIEQPAEKPAEDLPTVKGDNPEQPLTGEHED